MRCFFCRLVALVVLESTGRPLKGNSAGRALINEKRRQKADHRQKLRYVGPSLVDEHQSDAGALESVLQENHLDDFLMRAMMAEREFSAEKEHTVFLGTTAVQQESHEDLYDYEHVAIPRRPEWTPGISREVLHDNETKSYLAWRANLAEMEINAKERRVTPYEKNLEVWRQLWRVVERSDVVIQIVDARNPLLFRSEDLEAYVKEVDPKKHTLLLVNKADLLSPLARRRWAEWFRANDVPFLFFSALAHGGLPDPTEENAFQPPPDKEQQEEEEEEEQKAEQNNVQQEHKPQVQKSEDALHQEEEDEVAAVRKERRQGRRRRQRHRSTTGLQDQEEFLADRGRVNGFLALDQDAEPEPERVEGAVSDDEQHDDEEEDANETETQNEQSDSEQPEPEEKEKEQSGQEDCDDDDEEVEIVEMSTTRVLNREQLLNFLLHNFGQHVLEAERQQKAAATENGQDKEEDAEAKKKDGRRPLLTIGMVGYPNVGKSSTINVLLRSKKVSVAPTPGKTKHFQTHFLPEHPILVCDCPGLVFPTFAHTAAELVLNGILSVDHLRDWEPSVALLCRKLGRLQIRNAYSIRLPDDKAITPVDLLAAYAKMRSFFRAHGTPDFNRCARILLKDAVAGKLVCCMPPPGLSPERILQFHDSYRGRARLMTIAELQEEERRAELESLREQQQQLRLQNTGVVPVEFSADGGNAEDHEVAQLLAEADAEAIPEEKDMPTDSLSRAVGLGTREEDDPLLRLLLADSADNVKLGALARSGPADGVELQPGQKRRELVSRKDESRHKRVQRSQRQKARNRFQGVEGSESQAHVTSAFGRDGHK